MLNYWFAGVAIPTNHRAVIAAPTTTTTRNFKIEPFAMLFTQAAILSTIHFRKFRSCLVRQQEDKLDRSLSLLHFLPPTNRVAPSLAAAGAAFPKILKDQLQV